MGLCFVWGQFCVVAPTAVHFQFNVHKMSMIFLYILLPLIPPHRALGSVLCISTKYYTISCILYAYSYYFNNKWNELYVWLFYDVALYAYVSDVRNTMIKRHTLLYTNKLLRIANRNNFCNSVPLSNTTLIYLLSVPLLFGSAQISLSANIIIWIGNLTSLARLC